MFTFNESGTLYRVSKEAKGKKRFAVVGNNPMMNLLFGYTIRKSAGEDAEIYCIFDINTEINLKGEKIEQLMSSVFKEIAYHNLLRPVECLRMFNDVTPMDMTVNCADIPGVETINIIGTKSGGTVIFANFISNYNIALYVTEAISKDLKIRCADGYLNKYDEYDFEIVKELAPYFKSAGIRENIRMRDKSREWENAAETYKSYGLTMSEDFVAVSRSMKSVMEEIINVSKYDCNVLITGETGVGKEKVANIIQKNSSRKVQPFIKINCASISRICRIGIFRNEKAPLQEPAQEERRGILSCRQRRNPLP